ncbi:MAG: hypothetical protein U0R70_12110 [Solirubrobacteraceae bacterium]
MPAPPKRPARLPVLLPFLIVAVIAAGAIVAAALARNADPPAGPCRSGAANATAASRWAAFYERAVRADRARLADLRRRGAPASTQRAVARQLRADAAAARRAGRGRLDIGCGRAARVPEPIGPAPAAARGRAIPVVGLTANSQGVGPDLGAQQDRAVVAGAGWLREEFAWSTIQPREGAFAWRHYDRVLTAAARRGLRVLPVLTDVPGWAGPAQFAIPEDPSAYAAYVARVTARYGPNGSFWRAHPRLDSSLAPTYFEIWNEPYYTFFSDGQVDPARYARLFAAAATAGRAANPAAKFILAAEANVQPTAGPFAGVSVDWMQAMTAAVPNLPSLVDAVSAHPYSGSAPPDVPLDGAPDGKFLRVGTIRRAALAAGIDKPIWITEIGWSTCASNPSYCVSERDQSRNLGTMFSLVRTKLPYVEAVLVYHLDDLHPTNPSDKEPSFGLTRQGGAPKPAWNQFRAATAGG